MEKKIFKDRLSDNQLIRLLHLCQLIFDITAYIDI